MIDGDEFHWVMADEVVLDHLPHDVLRDSKTNKTNLLRASWGPKAVRNFE